MPAFFTILHILVAVCIVVVVLLQDAKGGAMGIMGGGGGSQNLFGATGASNFLVKATRWLGIVFAITCIYFASKQDKSVTDDLLSAPAVTAPAGETAPSMPAGDAPASDSTNGEAAKPAPEQK